MKYQELIKQDILSIVEELKVQPILFIGSGLSQRYFKAPNWKELMKQLTIECPNLDKEFPYYQQGYKDNYILMAENFIEPYRNWAWDIKTKNNIFCEELFKEDVQPQEYLKHIVCNIFRNITDNIDIENAPLKNEIKALQKISPHAIITTNYDGALEKIFPNYCKIVGDQIIRVNYNTYGEILKIHGCYNDHNSIILTDSDYKKFENHSKYLSAKLLTYFAEHPLFFFGYSVNDPNIISILSDIDKILSPNGELIPNIYFVMYEKNFSETESYQTEYLISLKNEHSIRVKIIYADSFEWIYETISDIAPGVTINPKLLRTLLDRVYSFVSSDVNHTKTRELPCKFETLLQNISDDSNELPKLFGLADLNDGQAFNVKYLYTLTQVAQKLKSNSSWYYAHNLLEKIKTDKKVDIKQSENKYHSYIITGSKSSTHKYSEELVQLLRLVQNNEDYQVDLSK